MGGGGSWTPPTSTTATEVGHSIVANNWGLYFSLFLEVQGVITAFTNVALVPIAVAPSIPRHICVGHSLCFGC